MKNIRTKIILLTIIFLSIISVTNIAYAKESSLYVSPTDLTKTTGDTFNVSVGFNASGNKVCAVEGTLNFDNLSCQSITVVNGVMTQSTPTCSNPYFLIGIPNCTTLDKVFLTISVRTGSSETASINFTEVDLIGEGLSVGSGSIAGNYTISSVTISEEVVEPNSVVSESESTITTETIQETETLQQEEDISTNSVILVTSEEEIVEYNLLASIGDTLSFGTGKMWIVIVITILAISLFITLYFIGKNSKKKK